MEQSQPITMLLESWRSGSDKALEQLTPVIYDELRRQANRIFRSENPGHTLQPTAVVNEALINLMHADVTYNDRIHFFSLAARMMRRILVDHAKGKRAAKRGGGDTPITLNEELVSAADSPDEQVLALDEALQALAEMDPRKAQVLEMHYFGGLTYEEMADVLGITSSTLNRDLRAARAWLKARLG